MNKMKRMVILLSGTLLCICALVVGCSKEKKQSDGRAFHPVKEVDFDTSMGKGSSDFKLAMENPEDIQRYEIFKSMYENNLPSNVPYSEEAKIPKILHQIWVGPKTPPSLFFAFREKWLKLHPDWEYKLWTEASLAELNLELQDIIDDSPNYAEKSDIIRSELLERFGGVYIDVDMEPHKPLTELNHKYDFYAGMEYPHKIATTGNSVWAGISIIACKAHHPIMKRWKEYIRARWEMVNQTYSSPVERVINHTYFPYTFAVLDKYKEENLRNIFFPATYFYPLTAANASKQRAPIRNYREKLYALLETLHLKKKSRFSRRLPETIAVHYWGNSWIPTPSEQLKEVQQQVDILKRDFFALQKRMKGMELEQAEAKKVAPGVMQEPVALNS